MNRMLSLVHFVVAFAIATPSILDAQVTDGITSLPTIDARLTISEAEKAVDDIFNTRIRGLEANIARLEEQLSESDTEDRIRLLEEKTQLLEHLNVIERTRLLASARIKYPQGYKLLNDMKTLTQALAVEAEMVAVYNALFQLTDLTEYTGWEQNFDRLLREMNNNEEKSWLRKLVQNVAIPAVETLGEFTPALSLATTAFGRLETILPTYVKSVFRGQTFVNTFENLSCGLQTVSQLNTDLQGLGISNASWQAQVDSLDDDLAMLTRNYQRPVYTGSAKLSDEEFYRLVESAFAQAQAAGSERAYTFADSVEHQITSFEYRAVEYHQVITTYIEFWNTMKDVLTRRRDAECLNGDQSVRTKFDTAITRIDTLIGKIRTAYLFQSTDKPEYEYYRTITTYSVSQ